MGPGGELTLEDRAIPPERLAALLARDGDIHGLLVQDVPPDRRMSLRPTATADGRRYWVIGP
ncbi:MAG TPA: hypothetical protein VF121_09565 [Thermoanaerobaculia bacterium]|nr:hypothetical protein [Thermoanaerobaculia bacterium]